MSLLRVAASLGGRDVFSHCTPLPRKLLGLIWQRQMKRDGKQHVEMKTKDGMKDAARRSFAPRFQRLAWSFLASFPSIVCSACRAPGDDFWPPQPSSPKHIHIFKDLHKIHSEVREGLAQQGHIFTVLLHITMSPSFIFASVFNGNFTLTPDKTNVQL